MKTTAVTLAVAMLLNSSNVSAIKASESESSMEKAHEYLRMLYAQVGEDYKYAQTEEERRRRRRVIKKEEYKDYGNLYPPSQGAVAKLRGTPWPCTVAEPCGEGEGTCRNPTEMYSHPDALCEEPFFCQDRVGGSRGGKGEAVLGVEFTGALKMHHMGANDICYDEEWETYGAPNKKMAVLRRKLVPCTHENPCGPGEGDCNNDDSKCKQGLKCAFRADEQTGNGEPLHGIDFTGDLLQNAEGANDLCYNPHWPQTEAHYEGKLVQTCDHSGNPVDEKIVYLVLESERRQIPDDGTFDRLFGDRSKIICKPEDAFEKIPVTSTLCNNTALLQGKDHPYIYLMVDGMKRQIVDDCTFEHMSLKRDAASLIPQCAFDGIPLGIDIKYGTCGGGECGIAKDLGKDGCTKKDPCACGEGDCDTHNDCQEGLRCFQTQTGQNPPGVIRPDGFKKTHDVCAWMKPQSNADGHFIAYDMGGSGCTKEFPCDIGYGDCDNDDDCMPGLECVQLNEGDSIPGLFIDPALSGTHDWCMPKKGEKPPAPTCYTNADCDTATNLMCVRPFLINANKWQYAGGKGSCLGGENCEQMNADGSIMSKCQ